MPRRVADYEIVGELGRGGMAVVHLARRQDGTMVALKELAGFHSGDDAAAQRFLREAIVGSSLKHENIVAVLDRLEFNGAPYIVMEWVDGGTLRPFVGELSLPQLAGILEGVLRALAQAGRQGVVHRDLKPENIMLTTGGAPKIADFGIAKAKNAVEGAAGRITRTGTAVGTPGYMAPEQAMAGDVSPATDLYAAGCVAFEALTGRLPFAGQAPMVMLMSHANMDVPRLTTIDPLIAEPIADWVEKVTARDPDDRFEDGDEAWEAFEAAVIETVGPDWRDQSAVSPEPAEYTTVQESGPATGSFATFAAPVALHEALAGELGERATFGNSSLSRDGLPASPRLTRDQLEQAVRDQGPTTPASVPAATSTTYVPEPPDHRNRNLALAGAGVLVVAIIVVVVIAASGGGTKLPDGMKLTSAGISVHAPAAWQKQTLAPVAGVPVSTDAGPGGNQGVALLDLPTPKLLSAGVGASPKGVTVGPTRAAAMTAGGTELLLLPRSSGGIATLVCRGSQAQGECTDVAETADDSLASAPTTGDAQTARGVLTGQRAAVVAAGRSLSAAKTGNAQVSAAQRIADGLSNQRAALNSTELSVSATAASDLLEQGLVSLAQAWNGYGTAIRAGHGTTAARAAVRTAQAELGAASAEATALGLPLSGQLFAGPTPPAAKAYKHPKTPNGSNNNSSNGSNNSSSNGSNNSSSNGSNNSSSNGSNNNSSPNGGNNSSPTHSATTPQHTVTQQQQQTTTNSSGPVLPGGHTSTNVTGGS